MEEESAGINNNKEQHQQESQSHAESGRPVVPVTALPILRTQPLHKMEANHVIETSNLLEVGNSMPNELSWLLFECVWFVVCDVIVVPVVDRCS